MSVLREMFSQHIISRVGNVPWPTRSPDLSVCYCFLWGYLQSRVFISKPRTIAELRQNRKEEIAAIPEQMTRRVMENIGVRLKQFWEMVGDIWVTYFSKLKMECTEFSSDNKFYIKRWNLIVLFHFENRQVFLPHPVYIKLSYWKPDASIQTTFIPTPHTNSLLFLSRCCWSVQCGWNLVTHVGRLPRISLQLCFKLAITNNLFLQESHYM